jgi:uncharacterized protein YifN (PemK superfamily)
MIDFGVDSNWGNMRTDVRITPSFPLVDGRVVVVFGRVGDKTTLFVPRSTRSLFTFFTQARIRDLLQFSTFDVLNSNLSIKFLPD